jgi:hypothetical protein
VSELIHPKLREFLIDETVSIPPVMLPADFSYCKNVSNEAARCYVDVGNASDWKKDVADEEIIDGMVRLLKKHNAKLAINQHEHGTGLVIEGFPSEIEKLERAYRKLLPI